MKQSINFFFPFRLAAIFLLFALFSCESNGQKNYDESDWSNRRKIPAYIVEELPSSPDSLEPTQHFNFYKYGSVDDSLVNAFKTELESAVAAIEKFTGKQLGKSSLKCLLYPSPEMKGLLLKNSAPCHVDFDNLEIHVVVNDFFADHYLGIANELILSHLLGQAKNTALQKGLAIYFSANWQKWGHQYWAHKLLTGRQMPPVIDILSENKWENGSTIIYGTATASFCGFLIRHFGEEEFLKNYQNGFTDIAELTKFEPKWRKYINATPSENMASRPAELTYVKGFNFAHEGYRVYNGYGSSKASQSLRHQKNMEANAVAVVPYTYARYPKKPYPIPVVKGTGAENDESVIQSSEEAQELGLKVILKPQIWVGRGMWTGDIEMQKDEDWKLFFDHYGHWISHYAMLSEIYGWEMLCIGNELVQTSLNREPNWKKLIWDLRVLYNGHLTYAANWGDEFENVSFWDELDYIGLNCYYPLSHKDDPSDQELAEGFDLVVSKIERVYNKYKKPIIFTEIGFPCIQSPWKEPHNDWGDFVPNAEHQRRCYEIVFNGIKNKPWCNGILWWKYPSDLEPLRRNRQTGFTPHGKAAENVVAKWFPQLD
ncbi:MAG: hypothetical protein AAFZ15_08975 [Bacteroidota bacterium]